MRIRNAGMVCNNLWYLGVEESGVYLLEGEHSSMFISGGMSYIAPDIVDQIKAFDINQDKIRKLIILHSHFDHVGLVPFLKRHFPQIELYGSRRAWEILSLPKAIDTINNFSHFVTQRMRPNINLDYNHIWRNDISGRTVADNDLIDLGSLEAVILETPGHSSCSISVYVPGLKALFPSDAGGVPFKDMNVPTGNSDYTQFQKSLEKLNNLHVEILCADHYGYIIGDEARSFITSTIEAAARFREVIENVYRKRRDIDSTAQLLVAEHYKRNPEYFLSPEILTGVYKQMVRHISYNLDLSDKEHRL